MALALITLNVIGEFNGVVYIFCTIERHYNGEFFARKRELSAPAFFYHDVELGRFRNIEPSHRGNFVRRLRNNRGIQVAGFIPDGVAEFFFLFAVAQVATFGFQLLQHLIVDAINENHGIIGRAGCREIERFRHMNLGCGIIEVGRVVDRDDRVANTDPQGRCAA